MKRKGYPDEELVKAATPQGSEAVVVDEPVVDRVLVVDDDPEIRNILAAYLHDEGFVVSEAADGPSALAIAAAERPAIVILDLIMPGLSGTEVFTRLRKNSDVPVIMLTARVSEVDRVVGLELGADDYVGKPFSPREVVARVKSVLRRSRGTGRGSEAASSAQRLGDLTIDREGHEVRRDGNVVELTPMEFRILDALASNAGRALSRDQLLDKVAPEGSDVFDRTLDRHVANLRRKVERDPSRPRLIVTVFGVGYKLVQPA